LKTTQLIFKKFNLIICSKIFGSMILTTEQVAWNKSTLLLMSIIHNHYNNYLKR